MTRDNWEEMARRQVRLGHPQNVSGKRKGFRKRVITTPFDADYFENSAGRILDDSLKDITNFPPETQKA